MANCCVQLSGIIRNCDNNIGGIKRAWGSCFDEAGIPTIADGMITALGDTTNWHLYEFRKETGSVTTTLTKDDTVGSLYYSSDIVFQFAKQETIKRIEVMAIAQGDTAWIIEDNNGQFWYFGLDFPVTLTDGTAETGTAFADFNGYNLTLNDVQRQLPYEIDPTAMQPIINPEA